MSKKTEVVRMWKEGFPGADVPAGEVDRMLPLGWQLGEPPDQDQDAEDQPVATEGEEASVSAGEEKSGRRGRGFFGKKKDAGSAEPGEEEAGEAESGEPAEGEADSDAAEGGQE